jgi:hypothetical protein
MALLSAPKGEVFAQWFERTCIGDEYTEFVTTIPINRVYEIADEARRRGQSWFRFASNLEARIGRRD